MLDIPGCGRIIAGRAGQPARCLCGTFLPVNCRKNMQVSEAALCLSASEKPGGGYRNRTGLHGFAIRCVTSPPTRQPSRWDTLRGTLCRAQGRGTVPVALSRNGLIAEANSGRLMLLQKVVIHLDCFDPVANHSTGGSLRFLRKWAALSEGGTGLPQTSIRRKGGNKAADCSAFFCYGWVPPPVRPVEFS